MMFQVQVDMIYIYKMETQTIVVYCIIGSGILIKFYRKKQVLRNVVHNELLLICIIVIVIYWYMKVHNIIFIIRKSHWPHYLTLDHSRQEDVCCHLTATMLIKFLVCVCSLFTEKSHLLPGVCVLVIVRGPLGVEWLRPGGKSGRGPKRDCCGKDILLSWSLSNDFNFEELSYDDLLEDDDDPDVLLSNNLFFWLLYSCLCSLSVVSTATHDDCLL